jgi:hypothetical protein
MVLNHTQASEFTKAQSKEEEKCVTQVTEEQQFQQGRQSYIRWKGVT